MRNRVPPVTSCISPDGSVVTDPAEVFATFKSFFPRDLSEGCTPCDGADPLFDILPELDRVDQEIMQAPLSVDELTEALRGMPSGSAPGPDGLPSEFYRTFWSVLQPFSLGYLHQS